MSGSGDGPFDAEPVRRRPRELDSFGYPKPVSRGRNTGRAYRGGRNRPGGGQAPRRASRGWQPGTIVAAYLVEGEKVHLDESRSVRGFLFSQALWTALALIVAGLLVAVGEPLLTALAAIGLGAFAAYVAVLALQAWFTRFVITDLRLLRVSGVLNRQAEFIPWVKVTDVSRSETLIQYWARTATIRVESANERSGFRVIDDVDDPDTFYDMLVRMIDLKQGRVADRLTSD
jgi:Bacterial PH domain